MGHLPRLALVRGGVRTIAKRDMIIACPACGTRYAVPDAAIGSEGRTVRCAKCKHSWFQDPPELELTTPAPAPAAPETAAPPPPPPAPPQPEPEPEPEPPVARPAHAPAPETPGDGPSISHWRTPEAEDEAALAMRALRRGMNAQGEPAAPSTAPPPPADDYADPPFADDEPYAEDDDEGGSQFDYRAPFTRRRNTAKMWTLAAVLFAVLAGSATVAINYYGPPDWLPIERPTFGMGRPGLELDRKAIMRKEPLENGEEIFRVRTTITNTSGESLDVPNLVVVFSDARDRKIGDWVVAPSKRRLAPGETLTVSEAIRNIPPGAEAAELGWALR